MDAELTPPPLRVLLKEFAERHELRLTDLVHREKIAIQSVSVANALVNQGYSQLDDVTLADPAVGLLLNLLHRNFEHADASIVAFVSGCGSSAEVIARASIESSVNIIYILAGDRVSRLLAYFNHYLDGVDRQVEKWRMQSAVLDPNESEIHRSAIDRRVAANSALRQVVNAIDSEKKERWPPSIEERFRSIGESMGYRTVYARMSSETHADAEETLRYLVGRLAENPSLLNAMALETVWTTRFYFHFAVSFLLRASLAYARSYSFAAVEGRLRQELDAIERELVEISAHVGAG